MTCENLCIVLFISEQRYKAVQKYESDSKVIQIFYASKEHSINTISSQLIKFVSKSIIKVEFELSDFCNALSNYLVKLAKSHCNNNRNLRRNYYIKNANSFLFRFQNL